MLTTLASSNTGMQARQMLERKPPTWASTLSSTSSFSALRRPTSGLDSSSAIDELDRPAVDAAVLVDAVDRHLQADQRGLAAGSAGARQRLLGADLVGLWPRRKRRARAPAPACVAPSAPADAPYPITRRRVTLPRYQKSCASARRSIFQPWLVPLRISRSGTVNRPRERAERRSNVPNCPSAERGGRLRRALPASRGNERRTPADAASNRGIPSPPSGVLRGSD